MKLNQRIEIPSNRLTIFTVGFLFLLINGFIVNAQSVTRVQNLSFGNFITYGNGGTITITSNNVVSKNGGIISKSNPTPAIFDLYGVEVGKTVNVTYDHDVTLSRAGGSEKMTLVLDDYPSPTDNGIILTGPSPTRIKLGGTLTIGSPSVTPVGIYSQSFQVSFTVIHP